MDAQIGLVRALVPTTLALHVEVFILASTGPTERRVGSGVITDLGRLLP